MLINECGLRILNSATVPSRVIVLSSIYVPANEWCAYAATLDIAATVSIKIKNLDFILSSSDGIFDYLNNCVVGHSATRHTLCQLGGQMPSAPLLGATQILVNRLNEHLRCPGWVPVETRFVFIGIARFGGLNLLERQPLLDPVLNAVPNDGDHVAIFEQVMFIGDTAVAWNQHRATFLQMFRHGDFKQRI